MEKQEGIVFCLCRFKENLRSCIQRSGLVGIKKERKKGVMESEVGVLMEIYKEAEASVKLKGEMSEWFLVKVWNTSRFSA